MMPSPPVPSPITPLAGLPPPIAAALEAWKLGRYIQRPIVIASPSGTHVIPEQPLTDCEREMIECAAILLGFYFSDEVRDHPSWSPVRRGLAADMPGPNGGSLDPTDGTADSPSEPDCPS